MLPSNSLVLLVNVSYILKKLVFSTTVKMAILLISLDDPFLWTLCWRLVLKNLNSHVCWYCTSVTFQSQHYLLSGAEGVYHYSIRVFLYIQLHRFTALFFHLYPRPSVPAPSNFFRDICSVTICLRIFCIR